MKTRDLIKILTELTEIIPEEAESRIYADLTIDWHSGFITGEMKERMRAAGWSPSTRYACRDIS